MGFLYILNMFSAEFSMLREARLKHDLHLYLCHTAGTYSTALSHGQCEYKY